MFLKGQKNLEAATGNVSEIRMHSMARNENHADCQVQTVGKRLTTPSRLCPKLAQ